MFSNLNKLSSNISQGLSQMDDYGNDYGLNSLFYEECDKDNE